MRSTFRIALIAAVPVEVVNFWLIGYPASSTGPSLASRSAALALEWYLLHMPGVIAGDRSVFLRAHPPLELAVLFASGYCCSAVLIAAALFLWERSRRIARMVGLKGSGSRS